MNNKQINASFAPSVPNGETPKALGFKRVFAIVGYVPTLHPSPNVIGDFVGDILLPVNDADGIATEVLLGPAQLNRLAIGSDSVIYSVYQ